MDWRSISKYNICNNGWNVWIFKYKWENNRSCCLPKIEINKFLQSKQY